MLTASSKNAQFLLMHIAKGFKLRDFLLSSTLTDLLWQPRAADTPSADQTTAQFTLWRSRLMDSRRWLTFNSVPCTTVRRPDKGQALLWDRGAGPTSLSERIDLIGACRGATNSSRRRRRWRRDCERRVAKVKRVRARVCVCVRMARLTGGAERHIPRRADWLLGPRCSALFVRALCADSSQRAHALLQ